MQCVFVSVLGLPAACCCWIPQDDVDDLPSEEGDWVDAAELLKVRCTYRDT